MYLQKVFDKRRNKTYLSVARWYRDSKGKVKHNTIEYFGAVEDLLSIYDDQITHFKEIVKQMKEEEKYDGYYELMMKLLKYIEDYGK